MRIFIIFLVLFSCKKPVVNSTSQPNEVVDNEEDPGDDSQESELEKLLKNFFGGKAPEDNQTPGDTPPNLPATDVYYYLKPDNSPNEFSLYMSPFNEFKKEVRVDCPGDSFVADVISEFDGDPSHLFSANAESTKDRKYTYGCRFFADGTGLPTRKANCSIHPQKANGSTIDLVSDCPDGKFIAGARSVYDPAAKDRRFENVYCEMYSSKGLKIGVKVAPIGGKNVSQPNCAEGLDPNTAKALSTYSSDPLGAINKDVNLSGQVVQFSGLFSLFYDRNACLDKAGTPIPAYGNECQTVFPIYYTILVKESSRYTGAANLSDRMFSFKTCALEILKTP